MSKIRVILSGVVLLSVVLAGALYMRQATAEAQATQVSAKPDAKFACSCTGGGITAGMAVLHCTCGTMSCLAVRSSATPGDVAVSCK